MLMEYDKVGFLDLLSAKEGSEEKMLSNHQSEMISKFQNPNLFYGHFDYHHESKVGEIAEIRSSLNKNETV